MATEKRKQAEITKHKERFALREQYKVYFVEEIVSRSPAGEDVRNVLAIFKIPEDAIVFAERFVRKLEYMTGKPNVITHYPGDFELEAKEEELFEPYRESYQGTYDTEFLGRRAWTVAWAFSTHVRVSESVLWGGHDEVPVNAPRVVF